MDPSELSSHNFNTLTGYINRLLIVTPLLLAIQTSLMNVRFNHFPNQPNNLPITFPTQLTANLTASITNKIAPRTTSPVFAQSTEAAQAENGVVLVIVSLGSINDKFVLFSVVTHAWYMFTTF